jgi:S1-C subfamily serine protease
MESRLERKVILTALLILIPITSGLAVNFLFQMRETSSLSASSDGYVPPKWVGALVEELQKSLVEIQCGETTGSGFSFGFDIADISHGFKFKKSSTDEAKSRIITNQHVIEECQGTGIVNIVLHDGTRSTAKIAEVDVLNDLALLEGDSEIEFISGAYWMPRSGYWTMALGSPYSFAGSVTFGNIINHDLDSIFHTASLSPGNSGGPLVDNEGYLYGVNTGSKPVGQNFNISIGVNSFCTKIITCPKDRFWADE